MEAWVRIPLLTIFFFSNPRLYFLCVLIISKLLAFSKDKNRSKSRARLHGGGGPQTGEVTCDGSPHLSCKLDQIKTRTLLQRHPLSLAWRLDRKMRRRLILHETGFTWLKVFFFTSYFIDVDTFYLFL